MALRTCGMHRLILRLDTSNPISQEGWKYLVRRVIPGSNFDGEIILFRAMNFDDILGTARALAGFGFKSQHDCTECDFFIVGEDHTPDWLEEITVTPLVPDIDGPFQAWRLRNSQSYEVCLNGSILTKGYEVDWPPLIGKIGS